MCCQVPIDLLDLGDVLVHSALAKKTRYELPIEVRVLKVVNCRLEIS